MNNRKCSDDEIKEIQSLYAQGHSLAWLGRKYEITAQTVRNIVNPGLAKCYQEYQRALRHGEIVKQPCEICGELIVQGHHVDYSKPLDVRWLCQKHHIELHLGPELEEGMKEVKVPKDRRKKDPGARLTEHVQVLFTPQEYARLKELSMPYPIEGNVSKFIRGIVLQAIQPAEIVTSVSTAPVAE